MASMKALTVRFFFWLMGVVDKICSLFGHKICKVSHEAIFRKLDPDAVKEGQNVITPLSLMVSGFQGDDRLDVKSRLIFTQTLRHSLIRRVAIQRALEENPGVLKTPIRRPVFIIGFPRTGTTMLHNLLGQDPQFFSPMFWELLAPYPPGRPDNWRECERYKDSLEPLELHLQLVANKMQVAHEIHADSYEECLVALGRSFIQYMYFMRLESMSGIQEWFYNLKRPELADIYRYYKKQLQLIGCNHMERQTYLLKSHIHLISLDALLDVFPDACLIFTYRPMTEVIPSFCSMLYKGTTNWGDYDANYGKRALRLVSEFANRAVGTMKRYEGVPKEKQPFFNINYEELVQRPLETVKSIYSQYGFTYTAETEARQRAWLASNPQHKHGKHHYSMQEYGLTEKDISQAMKPYLDYFTGNGKLI